MLFKRICIAIATILLILVDQYAKNKSSELVIYQEPQSIDLYRAKKVNVFSLEASSYKFEFNLNHVRNKGSMWNIAAGLSPAMRPIFYLSAGFLAAAFLLMFARMFKVAASTLSLLLAGAGSNSIDRMIHGYVVDVFDLRLYTSSRLLQFPNFNIADIFILIGLLFLMKVFFKDA